MLCPKNYSGLCYQYQVCIFIYDKNALRFEEKPEISVSSGVYWQSATSVLKLGEEEKEINIVVYLNVYTHEVEVEIFSEHNLGEFEFISDFSVNEISGQHILSVKKPLDDQYDNNTVDDESYFGTYFYYVINLLVSTLKD